MQSAIRVRLLFLHKITRSN